MRKPLQVKDGELSGLAVVLIAAQKSGAIGGPSVSHRHAGSAHEVPDLRDHERPPHELAVVAVDEQVHVLVGGLSQLPRYQPTKGVGVGGARRFNLFAHLRALSIPIHGLGRFRETRDLPDVAGPHAHRAITLAGEASFDERVPGEVFAEMHAHRAERRGPRPLVTVFLPPFARFIRDAIGDVDNLGPLGLQRFRHPRERLGVLRAAAVQVRRGHEVIKRV